MIVNYDEETRKILCNIIQECIDECIYEYDILMLQKIKDRYI